MSLQGGVLVLVALIVLLPIWLFASRELAKYRAFKTGAKRMPFWGVVMAEWVFWDPGEYIRLSGQGNSSRTTQTSVKAACRSFRRGAVGNSRDAFLIKTSFRVEVRALYLPTWTPRPISTSILWRVDKPALYVSKIAAEYHEDGEHRRDPPARRGGAMARKACRRHVA